MGGKDHRHLYRAVGLQVLDHRAVKPPACRSTLSVYLRVSILHRSVRDAPALSDVDDVEPVLVNAEVESIKPQD